jgi:hypothetical protein
MAHQQQPAAGGSLPVTTIFGNTLSGVQTSQSMGSLDQNILNTQVYTTSTYFSIKKNIFRSIEMKTFIIYIPFNA